MYDSSYPIIRKYSIKLGDMAIGFFSIINSPSTAFVFGLIGDCFDIKYFFNELYKKYNFINFDI